MITVHRRKSITILFIFAIIFFILFFVLPFLTVLRDSIFTEDGRPTLKNLIKVVSTPYYLRIIGFTALQAGTSALFSVLLGLPGAYLLSHFSFPGKRIIKSITTIPFVMPAILVVLGFIQLFGNNGIINHVLMRVFNLEKPVQFLYSFSAIILAHVFYNFPIAMRLISSSWENLSRDSLESARTLGAGPLFRFRSITLPRLMPGIISSWLLIFLFCFLSFAVILVLGGGPRFTTTEVEVYRLARFSVDFQTAGALGVVQSFCTLLILFFYTKLQNRFSFQELRTVKRPLSHFNPQTKGPAVKAITLNAFIIYGVIIFIIIVLPIVTIVIRSFQTSGGWAMGTHFTLKWYKALFSPGSSIQSNVTITSIINSLLIALGSTSLSLFFGITVSYWLRNRKRGSTLFFQTLFLLPMGISTILLGLGYLRIIHIFSIQRFHLPILIMVHSAISFPFVFRALQPSIINFNNRLTDAAALLGAGKWRIFRTVEAPLLKTLILSAGVFAFAISIGEMNSTLILAPEGFVTLPIAVYRLISSYNFFGACALGTILLILCGAAFYLVDFILPKERL